MPLKSPKKRKIQFLVNIRFYFHQDAKHTKFGGLYFIFPIVSVLEPKRLKSPKKLPKSPQIHPDAPILQLQALGCDNYI